MFGLDLTVLTTIVALPAGLVSFGLVRAARSSDRNRQDRCGNCGGPLYAPDAKGGPSLLQGHLVCDPCATKARDSLTRSLIAAAGITTATVLGLAAVAVWAPAQLGLHPWIPVLATLLGYPPIFAGAVGWMKRANRRAARRLGLEPHPLLTATNDRGRAGGR